VTHQGPSLPANLPANRRVMERCVAMTEQNQARAWEPLPPHRLGLLVRVSKFDAASRQLDAAIEMMFDEADPLAVHTVAAAASGIASSLIEHHMPEKSWDAAAMAATELNEQQYYAVKNKTQNFLKHAKTDPDLDGVHEFTTSDTESIMFWAVLNLAYLLRGDQKLTMSQSVYQFWFMASWTDSMTPPPAALKMFGDLTNLPRAERLAAGRRELRTLVL